MQKRRPLMEAWRIESRKRGRGLETALYDRFGIRRCFDSSGQIGEGAGHNLQLCRILRCSKPMSRRAALMLAPLLLQKSMDTLASIPRLPHAWWGSGRHSSLDHGVCMHHIASITRGSVQRVRSWEEKLKSNYTGTAKVACPKHARAYPSATRTALATVEAPLHKHGAEIRVDSCPNKHAHPRERPPPITVSATAPAASTARIGDTRIGCKRRSSHRLQAVKLQPGAAARNGEA